MIFYGGGGKDVSFAITYYGITRASSAKMSTRRQFAVWTKKKMGDTVKCGCTASHKCEKFKSTFLAILANLPEQPCQLATMRLEVVPFGFSSDAVISQSHLLGRWIRFRVHGYPSVTV